MLIHILREDGIEADVDESLLIKTDGVLDNDNERTTWVEYRFPGSDVIVHRSVHVTLKKWPDGAAGIAEPLA
jgi:hypothetical protein